MLVLALINPSPVTAGFDGLTDKEKDMATYRYEKKMVIQAINYSEAKRQIEARIRCPINPFRLEIQMPNGEFSSAAY